MSSASRFEKGVVLTATELEGFAPGADWSLWARSGKAPSCDDRSSFLHSWAEDLEQLASLNIDSVQLTLEWARLEPRPGEYDEAAIEFRLELLRTCRRLGLTTWACLVDGSLPGWFADDEGGFRDDKARGLLWPRHVDWIGERFGDLVDGWIPQREAITWALRSQLTADAPPGGANTKKAADAVRAAVLADGEAWRLLQGSAPVATYQTARPIRAVTDNVKAGPRAQGLERLLWHPWISALTEGRLLAGDLPPRLVEHLDGAFDRVIVELRSGIEVDGDGNWNRFALEPGAAAELLRRCADELGDREIIAAGSLSDVVDDGRNRADHVEAMLGIVGDAANETSVTGWWQSSPIDGYHWEQGYRSRPGLIDTERVESEAARKFRNHQPPG